MPEDHRHEVTLPEAARMTGYHYTTLLRWYQSGRLPARRLGPHAIIVDLDDLSALVDLDDSPAVAGAK